ncbi:hypothetical protein PBI_ISOLDE_91 [Arthrobacter phage Isolde]|uniref:Uncharacterized protein n=1 Tax=Arthrobacter phage Isolde TaxID=2419610 RepID=A0A3G3M3P6_9CAUD|nr:hypothetical protein PP638_gp12 [Arthrobacter phage Isolde]AYR01059.1 hypothetical protein PBI_ISOLDE_91 [Arthrobacter phage Isolde]
MSNTHHRASVHLLALENEPTHGSYIDPNTHNLINAQVEAALAIAFEQRTANLIALLTAGRIDLSDGSIGLIDDRLMELQQEVLERLSNE